MPFSAFVEIYCQEQKPRLKESTWQTKENIIQQKILPYFGNYKINEITTKDVRACNRPTQSGQSNGVGCSDE